MADDEVLALPTLPAELLHTILSHLPWRDFGSFFAASRSLAALQDSSSTWLALCEKLTLEGVSTLRQPTTAHPSWRDVFLKGWADRRRLLRIHEPSAPGMRRAPAAAAARADNAETFNISVVARFCPLRKRPAPPPDAAGAAAPTPAPPSSGDSAQLLPKVVIPLHQRLQMIQARYQCTPSEARRRLWAGDDAAAVDHWAEATLADDDGDNKENQHSDANSSADEPDSGEGRGGGKAAVARPAARSGPEGDGNGGRDEDVEEDEEDGDADGDADGDGDGLDMHRVRPGLMSIHDTGAIFCAPSVGLREFCFDRVLGSGATQPETYDVTAANVVMDFVNGFNGCIFCYGQTGSGKTHTMFGPDEASASSATQKDNPEGAGIVPRSCRDIMAAVARKQALGIPCTLGLSYVEVFGEEVSDLLRDGELVGPWQGVAVRSVLEGSAQISISSMQELNDALARGHKAKRMAATAMNERSSRAHVILMFNLQQVHPSTGHRITSHLCMADLGGSEQLKKSLAEGDRRREAVQINMGLLALKQCITALNKNRGHVPFQDSKLTALLKEGLGGNSRTVVVITNSMDSEHAIETLQTLRFGEKCSRIETEGGMRISSAPGLIAAMNREIEMLEEQIKLKERWESRKVVRKDMEGEEVMIVTVPVGAESERLRYEEVLRARDALAGSSHSPRKRRTKKRRGKPKAGAGVAVGGADGAGAAVTAPAATAVSST